MDGIAATIDTEASTQRVRAQALCYFGVHGAGKITECLNCVLLTDLHDDARASGQLLAHWRELRQDALIDLEELLSCWPIQMEHLHGRDFEAFRQNVVNDLTGETSLDCVRLDHSASVVGEKSRCLHLTEEHAHLSKLLLVVGAAM